eukprot:COSAG01_NODE_896_length_12893_cov_34.635298_6_plen_114_part_00
MSACAWRLRAWLSGACTIWAPARWILEIAVGSQRACCVILPTQTLDPKKVAKEMKRQKKAAKRAEAEMADERARGYNSFAGDDDGDVTAEQMEAYKMSKPRWDDPLTKMTDTT